MSKVWFITGAGSGIGTGIAKAALEAGDRVVATGRNLDKVREPSATWRARTSRSSSWTLPTRRRRKRPSRKR